MYAVRCTRPDVAFAQNITSRFQQNPGDIHWTTVKNILKYLRNTKDMFLVYGGARHFCAKVHYLREVIDLGDIKLEKVYTYDNLADPFTKALAFPKHSEHTKNIGMLPASSLIQAKPKGRAEKDSVSKSGVARSFPGSYPQRGLNIADIKAIRILIAIAAYYDYEIWQIDVKNAFLNGYLNEEVYMEQPEGFVNPKHPNRLKLSKSQGASTPAEMKRVQNVPYASATGYVFVLNDGVVDWKSTKQSIFATSSAEAEYIAAFDASKEAVWVRKFIFGLGVVPIIKEPISMYCDNTGAIAIANESGIIKGARHFRAKVHYLRDVIEFGDIKLEKVHTHDNLADPFTKALAFPKHSEHTKNIGMLPASSLM
nr:retrovirus-related Pol polyprotein from transposon TNT 1-94 [Tanacetum cinerariifolium]